MTLDKKLRIILLRHGKTIYNKEKRLQGPKDSLTDEGKEQILRLQKKLDKFSFDEIISSDEKRAIESTEIISHWINKDFKKIPLIREKSSGDFSDKLVNEVDWSLVKGSFLEKKIPGGESVKDVIMRASEFFKILNEFKQGKTVLVVSHGTFLRVLFCLIFNEDIQEYLLNYEFPNSSYIIISRSELGKWTIEESPLVKKGGNKDE
ncbi:MAG: histidine phosphatase family protein [Nanoarchaeota archaeon]|mgnify:CR=1 FL=1